MYMSIGNASNNILAKSSSAMGGRWVMSNNLAKCSHVVLIGARQRKSGN